MAKYIVVTPDQVPNPLRNGEFVINYPDFIEEINASQNRTGSRRNLTTASYLRSIANMIAINYDPTFDALRDLKPHDFQGRKFDSVNELSSIVVEMLQRDYPKIFSAYLDKKIKERPRDVKVIYYTGKSEDCMPFLQNGIDNLIDLKEVDSLLNLKGSRTAKRLSKEESEELSTKAILIEEKFGRTEKQ